jgi:hypothetical protein
VRVCSSNHDIKIEFNQKRPRKSKLTIMRIPALSAPADEALWKRPSGIMDEWC